MNLIKYIISEYDVFRYSGIAADEDTDVICNRLDCVIDPFVECFGYQFWQMLLDDIKSCVPENYIVWCAEESKLGDYVYHQGWFYQLTNMDGYDPEEGPDCSTNWKRQERFKNECFRLIETDLIKYLATFVYGEVYPFLRSHKNEDYEAGHFKIQWNMIKKDCRKRLDALKRKIIKLCDEGCSVFECITFISDMCGDACKKESNTNQVAW